MTAPSAEKETGMTKRRKAKFRKHQVVFCDACVAYLPILKVKWDDDGVWTYALNKDEVQKLKQYGKLAHLDGDLRPLTARERGDRKKGR